LFLFSFAVYAVPKDDFANVLNLAKFSSCSELAKDLLNQKSSNIPLTPFKGGLNQKLPTPFPWRFEITNGYKEGFFYYALLGYANELSGDIPYAYQCYRNATLYIDEEKSFNHPEPTAEIYLGIGRTCLAAGRYMDAKDWLDSAYVYANDNPNIMAAIDRVMIKRGNELGDYEDIILHYQHLESIANSKSPPLKGDLGGCKLTKEELANYAQILFWSHKDREGFSKLLEGISKFGIDNNLGVKDPLVDKFLNNIMRADDEDVKYFYDLLGYEIEIARAKAGDENYLAFLCNARTLFCKVYDFLNPKDDLKKVKKRIDIVKEQLKQGYDVFGKNPKSVIRNPWSVKKKKIIKSQNRKISKTGIIEELPEVELENLLMEADFALKQKTKWKAKKCYNQALQMATGTFANIQYDGTTTRNAAIIGMKFTTPKRQTTNVQGFDFDNSYRSAELTLQLYQKATNDEQRAEYNMEAAILILPKANTANLNFLQKEARRNRRKFDFDKALELYKNYDKRTTAMPQEMREVWCKVNAAIGNTKESFRIALDDLFFREKTLQRFMSIDFCATCYSWANDEDLEKYFEAAGPAVIFMVMSNPAMGFSKLAEVINEYPKMRNNELELRNSLNIMDYKTASSIYTNYFINSAQPGHLISLSQIMMGIGSSNTAFDAALEAYNKRNAFARWTSGNATIYPTLETDIMEACLQSNMTNQLSDYATWLINFERKCVKRNNEEILFKIKESEFYKLLISKKYIKSAGE